MQVDDLVLVGVGLVVWAVLDAFVNGWVELWFSERYYEEDEPEEVSDLGMTNRNGKDWGYEAYIWCRELAEENYELKKRVELLEEALESEDEETE